MQRLFLIVFFHISISGFAQQNNFFGYKLGSSWQIETYKKKGKLDETTTERITRIDFTALGLQLTIESIKTNAEGKQTAKSNHMVMLVHDTLYTDMIDLFRMKDDAMFKWGLREKIPLIVPPAMAVGDSLMQAAIVYEATKVPSVGLGNGTTPPKSKLGQHVSYEIVQRYVNAKENVVTPAGSFDAYKVTSRTVYWSELPYNITVLMFVTEWYVPGVGIVRSEVRNSNEKLLSFSVLKKRID